jgi:fucose permease
MGLIPVIIMALLTMVLTPQESSAENEARDSPPEPRMSFSDAIRMPMVWRFGIILGLIGAVENGVGNWSGLYLQDVFSIDPKTTGAAFISIYFFLITFSRLASGIFIEKAGYLRSIFFAVIAVIILYITGFALGRSGIWILPVTGLFIAIGFPTLLAVSIGVFGKGAQAASSAIIIISFSLNGIIQYLTGLINLYIGVAWGFRSSIVYGCILLFLLYRLQNILKGKHA